MTGPSRTDGKCACGCCTGIATATPQPISNRAGLPQIRYRPGGYPEFRASLHAALTSGDRPALAALTTRDDEDFTIALLDGMACVAEVLTFYTERLVNEFYLRTARDRVSLVELGRLVGYRLRPGVAAAGHLAFFVEPPPPPEVAAATSPFRRVRQPESVTIAAGVPVRSVPGPGEQPQVFETSESIKARPEWNLMHPVQTLQTVLGSGANAMYVKGNTANLKPGDLLLFTGSSGWQTRPVATVTNQAKQERTLVTWQAGLTVAGPLTPHVMRKRLSLFGHNAPMWASMSADFKNNYGCATGCAEWPSYWITTVPPNWGQDTSWYNKADVDGSHPDIAVGSHVVLAAGTDRKHFTVSALTELSRAEFGISGKTTRLTLGGDLWEWYSFFDKVRGTTVHAASEKLELAEEPDLSLVQYGQITVSGNASALPPGRTLIVTSGGKAETMTLKAATLTGASTTLTFTGNLAGHYDRTTVEIFGNVARATHGETVHQILGDGQAAQAFQRFELKHAPLTYVPSDDPSGSTSTLEIRVNDVQWHEVPTLYRAKPGDRIFTTRDTPTGEVVAGTGDGVRGSRVATGVHNVRARYRKGIGAAGNLPAGALTQLGAPPLGVTGVTNPRLMDGGADPDSAEHARSGIPLSTRTLGRAVSLVDYCDYARTFAGIAKAHAAVLPIRNVRTIVVTVAGEEGEIVPESVRSRLVASLRQHGDPLVPVTVVAHRDVPFVLSMKVRRHPDHELESVLKTVAAELTGAFGFAARDFGRHVHKSEVIAVAHRAAGVIAVDLDVLTRTTAPSLQERLIADGPEVVNAAPAGAELLLLAVDPLPWLKEMP